MEASLGWGVVKNWDHGAMMRKEHWADDAKNNSDGPGVLQQNHSISTARAGPRHPSM